MWYYVNKDRQQSGPVSVDALKAMLANGEITKRTHLWQEGRADWVRLEELAPLLGISLAAPPPTPPATVAMPSLRPMEAQPTPHAQPAYQPPTPHAPPAYQAPAPHAPPAYQPPAPQAPPAYQAPAPQTPPFQPPMPQAAPYAQSPAYPQHIAPIATASGGGGVKKFLSAFVTISVVGYFAYSNFGYLIPGVADKLTSAALVEVIDDLEPVRAKIAQVFKEKSVCPGETLKIEVEVSSNVVKNYNYGHFGEETECAVEAYVPADHKLKALANTRILFVLRNGEWLCGMSAQDKYRPAICDKIQATTE